MIKLSNLDNVDNPVEELKRQLVRSKLLHTETAERYMQVKKEKEQYVDRLNDLNETDKIVENKIELILERFDVLTKQYHEEQSLRTRYQENLIRLRENLRQIEEKLSDYQNRSIPLKKQCVKVNVE